MSAELDALVAAEAKTAADIAALSTAVSTKTAAIAAAIAALNATIAAAPPSGVAPADVQAIADKLVADSTAIEAQTAAVDSIATA